MSQVKSPHTSQLMPARRARSDPSPGPACESHKALLAAYDTNADGALSSDELIAAATTQATNQRRKSSPSTIPTRTAPLRRRKRSLSTRPSRTQKSPNFWPGTTRMAMGKFRAPKLLQATRSSKPSRSLILDSCLNSSGEIAATGHVSVRCCDSPGERYFWCNEKQKDPTNSFSHSG